jgi:hypothetical protein
MLLFIADLIAVGSIGFWITLVVFGIIMAELADRDEGIPATIIAVITFLAWFWLEGINPIDWIIQDPVRTILCIVGYFVVGIIWSIAKWWLFCMNARRLADRYALEFQAISNFKEYLADWNEFLYNHYNIRNGKIIPLAIENKSRIILWMSYWPSSMVWTLINDPVRRVFLSIYNLLGGMLQSISNSTFKGFDINKK